MIKIISTEEIEEDGVIYIVETYSNGTQVKYTKPEPQPEPPEPPEWEKDLLNEEYEAQLEERMNVQYLVDLAEINMEEM